MFAVKDGYDRGSQHQRAYKLWVDLLKVGAVRMQPIYSEREAEEYALLRPFLPQDSDKRQRQQ